MALREIEGLSCFRACRARGRCAGRSKENDDQDDPDGPCGGHVRRGGTDFSVPPFVCAVTAPSRPGSTLYFVIMNDAGPHADDLAIALRADPRLDGYDARLRQRGTWYQILVPSLGLEVVGPSETIAGALADMLASERVEK